MWGQMTVDYTERAPVEHEADGNCPFVTPHPPKTPPCPKGLHVPKVNQVTPFQIQAGHQSLHS